MKIFTIGFTQKKAKQFFALLRENDIQRLIDIRLHPGGQLAGFAKQDDLPYFLKELANGCDYVHLPVLAPSQEILEGFRADKDWESYVTRFENLMDERDIPNELDQKLFFEAACCLLCSESTAEKCHRRLVAERLARHWPDVEIVHL